MNYIRYARKKAGLTMKELGEKVGCTEAAISHYELDQRKPDYEMLLKISEELNTSVDFLMRGNEREEEKVEEIDSELVMLFSLLPEEDKAKVLGFVKGLLASREE